MQKEDRRSRPRGRGYFGRFGGQFIPEVLMGAVQDLEGAYGRLKKNHKFRDELAHTLKVYAGRPTPLTHSRSLSETLGCPVYLKREDLLHTGAHKINNTLGQVLLARWMGKSRIVAETGAGQHGVATAAASALFKIPCVIYMGKKDMERQALNVFRMELLGADVRSVRAGSETLKDAINEAIRDWITNVNTTYYVLGSVVGPHPYPTMVRDFQTVIGRETKRQMPRPPTWLVACVGGGSNAIGFFYPFLKSRSYLLGVEAAGLGLSSEKHAASLSRGREGILHGARSFVLQNRDGQIREAHSISAGLDYPGVGPEHAMLKTSRRVEYVSCRDRDALRGFRFLSEKEGIIPALEPAHAIGYLLTHKGRFHSHDRVCICLSGRGDKDVEHVRALLR